ncbi:MAG: hypothetical protein Pg6C_12470 [Treponemataceae bacterium]|nr:MAG: hypothetical protein Pg6C_12470 [Treponemataceae bacterium]
MNKKFVLGMLALAFVSVNVFGQNANQVIRDLTALAEGVNDYRDDVGVLTFNITDKTMAKAINIIQKFVNNGLRSQKVDNPMFFLGYAGMYAGECNVTISYDSEKSGRKRGIEIFHPSAQLYYSTPDGYFDKRKLPGE